MWKAEATSARRVSREWERRGAWAAHAAGDRRLARMRRSWSSRDRDADLGGGGAVDGDRLDQRVSDQGLSQVEWQ